MAKGARVNHTYTWSVRFSKDEAEVGLYHKKDHAMLAEILACSSWVEFILFHVPYGYRLWSKLLVWTSTQEELVFSIPATPEMLAAIAPDDEWLWNPEFVDADDQ